ncbi:hypothetical protein Syun_016692 [Stephania yunnanensis]|uniref:Protein kinase domain-containing protein n=1 Tax=Stephania yunnanensis TaxID=152371 RepID=A0AAP0J6I1_9MAGN
MARTRKNKATVALGGMGMGMPKADKKWYAAPTDSSNYRSAKVPLETFVRISSTCFDLASEIFIYFLVGLNGYIQLKFMKRFNADAKARTRIAFTVKAIVDERIDNGEIYRGKLKDGSLVAIRCLKLRKMHTTQNFSHQIELISKLRHRNLVNARHCFECYLDDSSVSIIFIVFKYVPNGTLRDCISGIRVVSLLLLGQLHVLDEVVMVVETIDVVAEVV